MTLSTPFALWRLKAAFDRLLSMPNSNQTAKVSYTVHYVTMYYLQSVPEFNLFIVFSRFLSSVLFLLKTLSIIYYLLYNLYLYVRIKMCIKFHQQ